MDWDHTIQYDGRSRERPDAQALGLDYEQLRQQPRMAATTSRAPSPRPTRSSSPALSQRSLPRSTTGQRVQHSEPGTRAGRDAEYYGERHQSRGNNGYRSYPVDQYQPQYGRPRAPAIDHYNHHEPVQQPQRPTTPYRVDIQPESSIPIRGVERQPQRSGQPDQYRQTIDRNNQFQRESTGAFNLGKRQSERSPFSRNPPPGWTTSCKFSWVLAVVLDRLLEKEGGLKGFIVSKELVDQLTGPSRRESANAILIARFIFFTVPIPKNVPFHTSEKHVKTTTLRSFSSLRKINSKKYEK